MKTVYVMFGEMGCGKSYWGSRYAQMRGWKFFEGDSVVTPRMLEAVSKFKPIPPDILQEYMEVLYKAIAQQMESCDDLIVSQALYLNKDRNNLKGVLNKLGIEVRFCWVKCDFINNIRNLLTREHGWKWVYYWLINKPFFQTPNHEHGVFQNHFA